MMYLRTGTPGAGKTLSTIDEVDKIAKKEGRDVYYTNIKDLTLEGWYELENGETWHEEIPKGAIYVCDEFYEIFPKLGTTAKRPEHYTLLAKHRHKALDVYLICQGVQQIDDFLKPLFQNHYHLIRSEMTDTATIFRSKGFIPTPHLQSTRKDLERSTYRFNKDLYGKYHSADKHTFQKRIPKIYKHLVLLLILFGICIYFVVSFFGEKTGLIKQKERQNKEQLVNSNHSVNGLSSVDNYTFQSADNFNPEIAYKPRVENRPETAPAYDELRKPKTFPKPNCLMDVNRCICYTQQATLMKNYPDKLCRKYVIEGRFEPTREDVKISNNSFNDRNFRDDREKKTFSQLRIPEYKPPKTKHFTTHWEREKMKTN